MQKESSWIILGILFIALGLGGQLNTVLLTAGLIFLISGLFMYKKYENRNAYSIIISSVLILMSFLTYLQLSDPNYTQNIIFNAVFFVLMAIVGIYVIYKFPKNWTL
ncbi:hypothetical protein [Methanobacterium alcaliphilum]|uniref:hypothetical protein n=1 Tax=Methanobacterium alcaliphilum TaxID=392018 RepID=UPI00200B8D5D|nr:hypothetical protein [Methanobacterium alcaliphilum]MCK9151983.1 hypothetical protein [Methanobacterium alcaliphilum]